MIHKIVSPFFNTLIVNEKYYLLNRDNLTQQIEMQLSEKQKKFSEFLFAFLKSILNFNHLPKKGKSRSLRILGNTGSEKHGSINV